MRQAGRPVSRDTTIVAIHYNQVGAVCEPIELPRASLVSNTLENSIIQQYMYRVPQTPHEVGGSWARGGLETKGTVKEVGWKEAIDIGSAITSIATIHGDYKSLNLVAKDTTI